MLKAVSLRSKVADIGIAMAVAALGVAAIVVPDILLHASPSCLISRFLEDQCWGCGMTRASIAFLHFDFATAWGFNKLSVVVLPMLFFLYVQFLYTIWRRYSPEFMRRFQQR
jgi:hypothetical protein